MIFVVAIITQEKEKEDIAIPTPHPPHHLHHRLHKKVISIIKCCTYYYNQVHVDLFFVHHLVHNRRQVVLTLSLLPSFPPPRSPCLPLFISNHPPTSALIIIKSLDSRNYNFSNNKNDDNNNISTSKKSLSLLVHHHPPAKSTAHTINVKRI